MSKSVWHTSMAQMQAELAKLPPETRAAYGVRHGTMRAGIYAPVGTDNQSPHRQDELYIVASGNAKFVKRDERLALSEGDLLFVEAHCPHRFEDMSADFATWVIFWGPDGGETGVQ